MDTLLPLDAQKDIEQMYSRKTVSKYLRNWVEATHAGLITKGAELVAEWMDGSYYESKMARIDQLRDMDIPELVTQILVNSAYYQREELFVSVTAQMAGILGFSDREDGIRTLAELLAVVCHTDAYDIDKDRQNRMWLRSNFVLPAELMEAATRTFYLPPMVCPPRTVTSNFDSGYLTEKSSMILGRGNHHDGELCLDVINIQNQIPLTLDFEFLQTVDEVPKFAWDEEADPNLDQQFNWNQFRKESVKVYALLSKFPEFFMTHRIDARGRMYAQGYHVSPQGASYKKAMIELANKEVVDGVPEQFRK